jgi:hypothetical protein
VWPTKSLKNLLGPLWSELTTNQINTSSNSCSKEQTIMAQGVAKLGKVKHSGGAQKKKVIKSKSSIKKGQKQKKPKPTSYNTEQKETTKAINRKNEALIAAKAVSAGSRFFLSDIAEHGTQQMNKQHQARDKKEKKKSSVADKVKQQIEKLEKQGV